MKKFALILCSLIMASTMNLSAETTQDDCCETINQIMDESAKEYREMSQKIMTEYIKEPNSVDIANCLAAIDSINLGFSFSLPSLDDLLQMACDFVKGQIESKLQEAASSIESKFSFGAYGIGAAVSSGAGTDGNSTIDFEVNDTSEEIVNSIWKSIQ